MLSPAPALASVDSWHLPCWRPVIRRCLPAQLSNADRLQGAAVAASMVCGSRPAYGQ